jgi:hypothetical protein
LGRRVTQVKSFWFDGTKITNPKDLDDVVNQFLRDTPGILNTPDYFPDISWGELGNYVICNLTYQIIVPTKQSKQPHQQ